MKQKKGGQIARSAGSFVQILGRDSDYVQLKLVSGEIRMVHNMCRATFGSVFIWDAIFQRRHNLNLKATAQACIKISLLSKHGMIHSLFFALRIHVKSWLQRRR